MSPSLSGSLLWLSDHAVRQYHAVLAQLSLCYSPLKGRLLIHYSPVRHWLWKTASCLSSSVRLACVRHAASVNPEPGSNSHKKYSTVRRQFNFSEFLRDFHHAGFIRSLYPRSLSNECFYSQKNIRVYHCLIFKLHALPLRRARLLYHKGYCVSS